MKKNVLLLGASGNIAPYIAPDLARHYELRLADIAPFPGDMPSLTVDVTTYEQVLDAACGMDTIMNFTVVRDDPVLSFHVSSLGAWHVMKAAAELGIGKVIHTGPEYVRRHYDHEFDIVDAPPAPGTGYYSTTKMCSREICRIFARTYRIQTLCYLFNGLGPSPQEPRVDSDFPPFTIVWEDLVQACRLGLEIESVPDDYQEFNLSSYLDQGKYSIDKARRLLGYEPQRDWTEYFRRKI